MSTLRRSRAWLTTGLRRLVAMGLGAGRRRPRLDVLIHLNDHELSDIGVSRETLRALELGVLPPEQALSRSVTAEQDSDAEPPPGGRRIPIRATRLEKPVF